MQGWKGCLGCVDHPVVQFCGENLDALTQFLGGFGKPGVLTDEFQQQLGPLGGLNLALSVDLRELLAVTGICFGKCLIAIGLTSLREQNQWRGVSGLETEREVQEDEWIDIKLDPPEGVHRDPSSDDRRLPDEEGRSAKKSGKCLGSEGKPVIAKDRREVEVRRMKPEMAFPCGGGGGRIAFHGGHLWAMTTAASSRGFAARWST
jgi:hypothetical protein